jgi:threonine dehydrogenase-like Zn-dependent dehydrogenase
MGQSDAAVGRRLQSVGFAAPRVVQLFEVEEAPLEEGQFVLDTLYSGVSAGTELTQFRGSNPYLHGRWDERLKLFLPAAGEGAGGADGAVAANGAATSQAFPLRVTGYMEVGRVVATRSAAVREGETVAMAYGHKSGHRADARRDHFVVLPEALDPILGTYVAQMGPICANGILHADEEALGGEVSRLGEGLRGRRVAVFGAGVVGLLTALLAKWGGAAEVAVADRAADRLAAAGRLGLLTVSTEEGDPAVALKERWAADGGERGADVAFQCSGSDALLQHALNTLRPQGTVIDMGFYQGGAPAVRFGEAFHHNGLRHVCAQIRRVPRRLAATWDRRRLSRETTAFLGEYGPQVRAHLITRVAPFAAAQGVFDALDGGEAGLLQAVLHP